jgi:hypothetical protein
MNNLKLTAFALLFTFSTTIIHARKIEIGLSVGYSRGLSDVGQYHTYGDGSYSLTGGYNINEWLQPGLDIGVKFIELSYRSTLTGITYETNYSYLRVTPTVKFQHYIQKYMQPFVSIGAGFYSQGSIEKSSNDTKSYSGIGRQAFGINARVGYNLGPKDGMFKLTLSAIYEKQFEHLMFLESTISPEIGILVSF